ncbi:hypothetical protein [Paenibacillus donghaensis]|uniref:hypothetical protein n=1 Tax=Paenibacillus donghaensis TaxID=414771 RepID=UPI0012FE4D55|nr:hypothetical protein [Paenibacillus donghaensis]
MNDYDLLIDELGSKIETRTRLQLQINLLMANVAELDDDIELLRTKIDEIEESGDDEY